MHGSFNRLIVCIDDDEGCHSRVMCEVERVSATVCGRVGPNLAAAHIAAGCQDARRIRFDVVVGSDLWCMS